MSKVCPSTGKDCEYTGCNPIGNECSLSMSKEESKPDNTESWNPFTLNTVPHPDMIDVRIRLLDGSELNVWQQLDGDFWSEYLQIFITPEKVTHWKQIYQNIEKELSELRKENEDLHQSEILWFERNAELESQLAEAKELLKTLVPKLRQRELHGTANEIESFLKS